MRCSILIFGESDTDTHALAQLVRAVNLSLAKPVNNIVIRPIKKPIMLSRNAERRKLASLSSLVAAIYRAEKTSRVEPIVVLHQDCDAPEPAHLKVNVATMADFTSAGVERIVTATAAWEIEAWWMLFPEALEATRSCWRPINYGTKQVGKIVNAKERLRTDLRPKGKSHDCPDYIERDSPAIATNILRLKLNLSPLTAKSESFEAFYVAMKAELEDAVFS